MVAFELRDYVESVERLEQALDAQERRLEGELRTSTEALLARARAFVARTRAADRAAGRGAGAHRRRGRGARRCAARAGRGRRSYGRNRRARLANERRTVTVVGGEEQTLHVHLRRLGERGGADAPSAAQTARAGLPRGARGDALAASEGATATDGDSSVLSSPWFWTAVVLVVGGGVTAGVLLGNSDDEIETPLEPRSGITVNALELAP